MPSLSESHSQPPPPGRDPVGLLTHYETSVAGLRAGLVDLETAPSFLMLSSAGLTGKTKDVAAPVAKRAVALWPLLIVVGERLEAARSLASQSSGFLNNRNDDLAELLALPLGPIDAEEFRNRQLTLADALVEIRNRYGSVRDTASEIEALWLAMLPRIDAATSTLRSLESDAVDLGVVEPLIGRAQALVEDLNERLVNDPLSIHHDDGDVLDTRVAEAVRQIATLQTGREDLAEDLAEAKQLLANGRTLRSRAAANRVESESKVLAPVGLVRTPSEEIFDHPENGLGSQLSRVVDTAHSWSAQRTLLDVWFRSARRLETQLSAAEARNAAPIADRQALRGRLRAYQAKMAAVGLAEDMELTGLVDAATDELFTVPTDLDRAARLISDLAERLRVGD